MFDKITAVLIKYLMLVLNVKKALVSYTYPTETQISILISTLWIVRHSSTSESAIMRSNQKQRWTNFFLGFRLFGCAISFSVRLGTQKMDDQDQGVRPVESKDK